MILLHLYLCTISSSKNPSIVLIVASLADISEMVLQLQGTMMKMENFQKLLELKKDLTGIDNLAIPSRVSQIRFIDCG